MTESLIGYRTFLTVARLSSFSAAARELHVAPSVVFKRVAQLEASLDMRLFERTTRKITLTESGRMLQARIAPLITEFEDVFRGMGSDEGRLQGHIRVMAPTTLTMIRLHAVFEGFLAQQDGITLELVLDERSSAPIEAGFDMVIGGEPGKFDGVVETPLFPVGLTLCAAPSHLRSAPPLSHPRDLIEHACLAFAASGKTWFFQGPHGLSFVEVRPRITTDSHASLLQLAESGAGFAVLPAFLSRDAIASGTLAEALPGFPCQELWYYAAIPKRRQQWAPVQALLNWVIVQLQT